MFDKIKKTFDLILTASAKKVKIRPLCHVASSLELHPAELEFC